MPIPPNRRIERLPPRSLAELVSLLAPPEGPDEHGRLGRYRIVDWLGDGGMGFVCKALQPDLNREVALKVMKPGLPVAAHCDARFEREARSLAKVHHQNVVVIHLVDQVSLRLDYGNREVPCLLME